MAWSTREIADLAGTTLRSVRHYHDVGLLPEPVRRANGYKQYGVAHLTRLLRIKRLVDLGFSLTQIADLGEHDEHPAEQLRILDGDLAAQIERLERLRAELAGILKRGVATDLPSEFAGARTAMLSEADRNIAAVVGRLLGRTGRATYAELLSDPRTESGDDFDDLAADADEATRAALAGRLSDDLYRLHDRYPGVLPLGQDAPMGPQRYRQALDVAMEDLYNPAQLDVLRRVRTQVRSHGQADGRTSSGAVADRGPS